MHNLISPRTERPAYQQRVIDEKADLVEKHRKLWTFIYDNPAYLALPPEEQERLRKQADLQGRLCDVLGERIAAFPEH